MDNTQGPIGIVSKSDYYILLNHLALKEIGNYDQSNSMFFRALLVKEIMTKNPNILNANSQISKAIELFIENKHRSIIIIDDESFCAGICTPTDILKQIKIANQGCKLKLIII